MGPEITCSGAPAIGMSSPSLILIGIAWTNPRKRPRYKNGRLSLVMIRPGTAHLSVALRLAAAKNTEGQEMQKASSATAGPMTHINAETASILDGFHHINHRGHS